MRLKASLVTFFEVEEQVNRNGILHFTTNSSSLVNTRAQMLVNSEAGLGVFQRKIKKQLGHCDFSNRCQMAVDVFRLSRPAKIRTNDCLDQGILDCSVTQVRAARRLLRQVNVLRRTAADNANIISQVSRRQMVLAVSNAMKRAAFR